ncbi:CU044_2847 family protein [Terrabacter sp. LjRoot27]|uniref:CU044_2847 family protein n=1 Tax=Terrabacter sp. LjRoot27 TaxID=3342306 RepID=UPI003ED08DA3
MHTGLYVKEQGMGQLVEFAAADGEVVLVEVSSDLTRRPVTRGLGGGVDVVERANVSFEEAVGRVQPAVEGVVARLRALPEAPDEVHVEFGLNLHAEAGAFIASASTTANFTVALTWRLTQKPKEAHHADSPE